MSSYAITHLFHRRIPIMKLMYYLTKELSPGRNYVWVKWMDFFSRVVSTSGYLSWPTKITALELLGACLSHETDCGVEIMFRCWKEALSLRRFPPAGVAPLPMQPYVGVIFVASLMVFGDDVEAMSIEELQRIDGNFERGVYDYAGNIRQLGCRNVMELQALLVTRKISSQAGGNQDPLFYTERLYDFFKSKLEIYTIDHSFELRMIAFSACLLIIEQLTGIDPYLLLRNVFAIAMKALMFSARYLSSVAKTKSSAS